MNAQEREVMQEAIADICGAKLCNINSMSSRDEMLRLMDAATERLRAALAQPEPEPVFWYRPVDKDGGYEGPMHHKSVGGKMLRDEKPSEWKPLYTAPPQHEWVGLTDDEYELMAEKRVTNYFFNTLDYAHDIEAMLKEKNGG